VQVVDAAALAPVQAVEPVADAAVQAVDGADRAAALLLPVAEHLPNSRNICILNSQKKRRRDRVSVFFTPPSVPQNVKCPMSIVRCTCFDGQM